MDLVTLTATLHQQIEDLEGCISRLDSHKSTLDKQIEGLERQNCTLKATERREKLKLDSIHTNLRTLHKEKTALVTSDKAYKQKIKELEGHVQIEQNVSTGMFRQHKKTMKELEDKHKTQKAELNKISEKLEMQKADLGKKIEVLETQNKDLEIAASNNRVIHSEAAEEQQRVRDSNTALETLAVI
ncbi:hypothetical protein F5051DRAFT_434245 [Lentinula edodes]|nr:hypothetical protein F5051DRAFT_434245 [Lentinula edodes]